MGNESADKEVREWDEKLGWNRAISKGNRSADWTELLLVLKMVVVRVVWWDNRWAEALADLLVSY